MVNEPCLANEVRIRLGVLSEGNTGSSGLPVVLVYRSDRVVVKPDPELLDRKNGKPESIGGSVRRKFY